MYTIDLVICRQTDSSFAKIVSLPNLCIIDFSHSHTGSTHDSTAWETMHLAQEHSTLMEDGEWVWADSAYPVHLLDSITS
jgi:hypothetical protein